MGVHGIAASIAYSLSSAGVRPVTTRRSFQNLRLALWRLWRDLRRAFHGSVTCRVWDHGWKQVLAGHRQGDGFPIEGRECLRCGREESW